MVGYSYGQRAFGDPSTKRYAKVIGAFPYGTDTGTYTNMFFEQTVLDSPAKFYGWVIV